jgi:hypothetical protein
VNAKGTPLKPEKWAMLTIDFQAILHEHVRACSGSRASLPFSAELELFFVDS